VKSDGFCGRRCVTSEKRDVRYVILLRCKFQTVECDVLQKLTEGVSAYYIVIGSGLFEYVVPSCVSSNIQRRIELEHRIEFLRNCF
jgi:hypothetical protein